MAFASAEKISIVFLFLVFIVTSVSSKESVSVSANVTNSTIQPVGFKGFVFEGNGTAEGRGVRQGKNLFDWIGLGTGSETDPYLARANSACLDGDLSECFKSRALGSLDEFFDKDAYTLTENVRMVRMPITQLRRLHQEPFEFSSTPRADEPEWDQFVKFLLRKVERFIKSTAVEVQIPNEVTEGGRYSPRFIDEIATEIDILEDKNESAFSRTKLKKLFIPLLIILKLFKLKLLLFLPLILGLASFKKLLGFLALVIPGVIGFFKLCKPDLHHNYGSYGHSNFYHQPPHHKHQYSPAGIGTSHHYFSGGSGGAGGSYYGDLYSRVSEGQQEAQIQSETGSSPHVAFRDEPTDASYKAQLLAYKGHKQFKKR